MPTTHTETKLPAAAPAAAPLDELEQLALRLRHAHRDVVSAAGNMIVKAMDAGELLIQAQQKVKRGTWMAWLAANCPDISDRTVRLYIELATGREVIEARMKSELATIANPTFTNALEWLNGTKPDTKSTDTTSATTTDTNSAKPEKKKKEKKPAEVYKAKQEELVAALRELSSRDHAEEWAAKTKARLDEAIAAWREEA